MLEYHLLSRHQYVCLSMRRRQVDVSSSKQWLRDEEGSLVLFLSSNICSTTLTSVPFIKCIIIFLLADPLCMQNTHDTCHITTVLHTMLYVTPPFPLASFCMWVPYQQGSGILLWYCTMVLSLTPTCVSSWRTWEWQLNAPQLQHSGITNLISIHVQSSRVKGSGISLPPSGFVVQGKQMGASGLPLKGNMA